MSGRPVRLLTAAGLMAAASLMSITAASAGCYSGCGYSAPVAYYSAPVVYSYAAPVTYAAPCSPCGYASYGYASPMYVVNQGPSYTAPVTGEAEDVYDYGYRRAYPYYSESGVRWHRRHWHRGYGYRGYSYRDYGYRDNGYRYGAVMPGYRHSWRPRYPMVGPGGIYRGPRLAVSPRVQFDLPRRARPMNMMRTPGMMHPRMMGPGPRGPMQGAARVAR